MSLDLETSSLSYEDNRVVSVEAPSLSLLSSSAAKTVWRICALPGASLRANPRQVNKQGLLHLWHLQCLVRQPVWHRQPEVRDANRSSAALKRSLLVHTLFTLPGLSKLQGTIIIGVHACCHTLTAQDALSKRYSWKI